jgi:hypothetical protein
MHYYFHILEDRERVRDPNCAEFSDLACARCARDLMAEELRCGCAIPAQWRIQIAQDDKTIPDTEPFTPIRSREEFQHHRPRPRSTTKYNQELIARALATSDQARTSHAQIRRDIHQS